MGDKRRCLLESVPILTVKELYSVFDDDSEAVHAVSSQQLASPGLDGAREVCDASFLLRFLHAVSSEGKSDKERTHDRPDGEVITCGAERFPLLRRQNQLRKVSVTQVCRMTSAEFEANARRQLSHSRAQRFP